MALLIICVTMISEGFAKSLLGYFSSGGKENFSRCVVYALATKDILLCIYASLNNVANIATELAAQSLFLLSYWCLLMGLSYSRAWADPCCAYLKLFNGLYECLALI